MNTNNKIKQNKSSFQFIHRALQQNKTKEDYNIDRIRSLVSGIQPTKLVDTQYRKKMGEILLFGKYRNDLEQNKLKKITGKGENNAEDDLNKNPFLFIFFI